MDKKKIFLLIFLTWLFLILGFIGIKEYTLRTGTEVLLKTEPVDPRDLFRGDYVILNYEISRIDISEFDRALEFRNGDNIYVLLIPTGDYHIIGDYSKSRFDDEFFIRGKVKSTTSGTITVEYGIESYFVPEGGGKNIENFRNDEILDVQASIDRFGSAIISKLLVDGNEINFKE